MAGRGVGKPAGKGAAGKAPQAAKKAASAGVITPEQRIAALEKERAELRAELAAAQARIRSLEQAREQVLNRIDWVIDSLQSLTED